MRVHNRNISLPDLQELCSSLNYTPSKGQLVSRLFSRLLDSADSAVSLKYLEHSGRLDDETLMPAANTEPNLHGYAYAHSQEAMIWEVDETLDGTVCWDELLLAYRRVRSDSTGLEPRALYDLVDFLMHDSDLDGTVAVDEARQLMFMRYGSAFQEKHVDELFEGSQGGGVSLDAFMKFAASQRDAIAKALDIKGGNVLSRGQMRAAQQEKIRKLSATGRAPNT